MTLLELHFFRSQKEIVLDSTLFQHPLAGAKCHCKRGRTNLDGCGVFQWSVAVQGLVVLAIASMREQLAGNMAPTLIGGDKSVAASLDYCISKRPLWLLDMFGVDSRGLPLARRLFRRENPERKRLGPVLIQINQHFLPSAAIKVIVNGTAVTDKESLNGILAMLPESSILSAPAACSLNFRYSSNDKCFSVAA